jgi:hypothetical protein
VPGDPYFYAVRQAIYATVVASASV